MKVDIIGTVHNSKKLTDYDIEELILSKAKEQGIEGYMGRLWPHYDEQIKSIN